ncbi:MAG: site-specific integrase [Fuerstiella sp.]
MTKIPAVRLVPRTTGVYQVRYHAIDTGKEVRLGAGRDPGRAEQFRKDVEAKLRLGIDPRKNKDDKQGRLRWDDFRELYSELGLVDQRSAESVEYKLDVVERAAKPRFVDEFRSERQMKRLELALRAGVGCGPGKTVNVRAPASVASILRALKAALNYGKRMEWIDWGCHYRISTIDADVPRGRPLTDGEVELYLEAIKSVCPHDVAGWWFAALGLLATALRLEELFAVTWDEPGTIRPKRTRSGTVVLEIPASKQKRKKTETVPTIPEFAQLLDTVPEGERTGPVFKPQDKRGKRASHKQAGRWFSKFGSKAGIVVNDEGKFASAHDLRRTFAMKLARAGVSMPDLKTIMRHSVISTTMRFYLDEQAEEVSQRIAEKLKPRMYLGTSEDLEESEST